MSLSIGMAMNMSGTKSISQEKLDDVIKKHAIWLKDHDKGVRADLSRYDLSEKDLSGVDLSEAILEEATFFETNMHGINLTGAKMRKSSFSKVDLTDAKLDKSDLKHAHLCHSRLNRVHACDADFSYSVLWNNDFSEAVMIRSLFIQAELCDGKFKSANLSGSILFLANIDYANFENSDMCCAILTYTENSFWATFEGANMDKSIITACDFDDNAMTGVVGLELKMACPEEGSFVAWMKSHDGKIVKVLIPEGAKRTGNRTGSCRASEVFILDIFDGESSSEEVNGLLGDEKINHKGERVMSENFDESLYHDGAGIHFCFSRAEAELIEYKEKEEDEDE